MSDAKTPLEMFYHWEKQAPREVFLRQPTALQWREYTWAEVGDATRRLAAWIGAQRLPAGSAIALWSSNTKDWLIVDFAIQMAGHVSVPLYPGQDLASAKYIVDHSESRLAFLGSFDQGSKADEVFAPAIARIAMQGCSVPCGHSLESILTTTTPLADSPLPDPDSVWTIVYTSGTTGNPKGVMHAHVTPGYVCPDLAAAFRLQTGQERFFSFLPMSHIAERIVVEHMAVYLNGTISFSEGLARFAEELRSVQPTFFFAVPRLWIKFKEGVDARIPPAAQTHLTAEQRRGIARQLGLSAAKCIITGSAPCPRDVQQWYIDMGILLRDAYGMTENCIHGLGWTHDDRPKPGCVGRSFTPAVEVRLTDEDEICFRSKALMLGYYKEPGKTAEVLRDGWYHTGDTGRIDEDGNLWITGRLSEVFKTTKGKFVRPNSIEDRFGSSELLAQFCVFGHGMDQPVVAVTLSSFGAALDRTELLGRLEQLLATVNADLPPWERVARILVAADEWTIDNALLTPTLKLRRKAIETRYRDWAIRAVQAPADVSFESA